MDRQILKRMTGEELLLLRILNGEGVRPAIKAELDRRARLGPPARPTARMSLRAGIAAAGRLQTAAA